MSSGSNNSRKTIAGLLLVIVFLSAVALYYSPLIQQAQATTVLVTQTQLVPASSTQLDPVAIYAVANRSVVTVQGVALDTSGQFPALGSVLGTGFVVTYSSSFYVVTNFHVMDGLRNATVTFSNGDAYPLRLVGSDAYRMVEKNDQGYHVKHILIKIVPTDEAEQNARKLAAELRQRIRDGASFEDVAKKYSEDKESAAKGGLVGSYPVDGLAPVVKTALKGLTVGPDSVSVSEVVPLDIGYHIFKVVGRSTEREYAFDEIKDQLRQMVLQEKTQNKYEQWLSDIKKRTFIDIKSS